MMLDGSHTDFPTAGKSTQLGECEVPATWESRHRWYSHQDGLVLAERLAADVDIPWADVVFVASSSYVSTAGSLLKAPAAAAAAAELDSDARRRRLGCWTWSAVVDVYAPESGGR